MVINEQLMNRSKEKAESILQSCIARLAISLDVDLDTLNGDYTIPVSNDDIYYNFHLSLKKMCNNLEKIQ